MKGLKILLTLILFLPLLIKAQQDSIKPSGSFYGDVFLNTNYNFDKERVAFRLNRLHFGYKYNFSDKLYFNGMIESAREDYEPQGDYNGITNLFEFCLGFKLNKVEGKFGLIGTEFNQLQEKLWKHRYVDKVFADKYGLAPTNDFGGIVIFKPSEIFNFDLALTNGEGHKTGQADSSFRYSLGLTVKPDNGFVARIYSDFLSYNDVLQTNLIGIIGYTSDNVSVGAEWNQQINSFNADGFERSGLSAYASYLFNGKYQLFGRYDYLTSNQPDGFAENWNIANDGQLIIAGLQYKLHEQITLALDYRAWKGDSDNKTQSFLFFDIEITF